VFFMTVIELLELFSYSLFLSMASTDFEPTYARRAFPCFDEPAMKAAYTLTIIRPKTHKSYANNPLNRTEPHSDPNWEIDYYDKTVPMSTYLVAYVVAEYESIFKTSSKGIQVEVAARPEAIQAGTGEFGLNEAAEIIDYFADYFNVSYPLPKSSNILLFPKYEV
jgi:aminopeptidase N